MKIRIYKSRTFGNWYVKFPLGTLWVFPSWDLAVKFAVAGPVSVAWDLDGRFIANA